MNQPTPKFLNQYWIEDDTKYVIQHRPGRGKESLGRLAQVTLDRDDEYLNTPEKVVAQALCTAEATLARHGQLVLADEGTDTFRWTHFEVLIQETADEMSKSRLDRYKSLKRSDLRRQEAEALNEFRTKINIANIRSAARFWIRYFGHLPISLRRGNKYDAEKDYVGIVKHTVELLTDSETPKAEWKKWAKKVGITAPWKVYSFDTVSKYVIRANSMLKVWAAVQTNDYSLAIHGLAKLDWSSPDDPEKAPILKPDELKEMLSDRYRFRHGRSDYDMMQVLHRMADAGDSKKEVYAAFADEPASYKKIVYARYRRNWGYRNESDVWRWINVMFYGFLRPTTAAQVQWKWFKFDVTEAEEALGIKGWLEVPSHIIGEKKDEKGKRVPLNQAAYDWAFPRYTYYKEELDFDGHIYQETDLAGWRLSGRSTKGHRLWADGKESEVKDNDWLSSVKNRRQSLYSWVKAHFGDRYNMDSDEKGVMSYTFRRTAATIAYAGGADTLDIGLALGHKGAARNDTRITEGYIDEFNSYSGEERLRARQLYPLPSIGDEATTPAAPSAPSPPSDDDQIGKIERVMKLLDPVEDADELKALKKKLINLAM